MSSLMTCAAVLALVSRSSAGNPNALKKRADSARFLTGRLTAILVVIGRSFPIGEDARHTLKHCLSDSTSDFAFTLCAWPPTMQCVVSARPRASAGRRCPPQGPAGHQAAYREYRRAQRGGTGPDGASLLCLLHFQQGLPQPTKPVSETPGRSQAAA